MTARRNRRHADWARRAMLGYLVLFVAFVIAVGVLAKLLRDEQAINRRLARDEHQTCVLQSRGLPAGHHLAAVIGDIGALLALGHTADEQRRGFPPQAIVLLADLRAQAAAYARLEAQQPTTRHC